MALPLETSQIRDDYARRAIEQLALRFPLHTQDLGNEVPTIPPGGTTRPLISWGLMAAAGGVTIGSPDVTNTRTALGTYTIAYQARTAGCAVIAHLRDAVAAAEHTLVTLVDASHSTVQCINPGVAFVDRPFAIIVIG